MIIKFKLGSWRFTFTMAPVTKVVGVNSRLPDGNHILMWDFDDTNRFAVSDELSRIQVIYKLPRIYILETKKHINYIAYCFKKCAWRDAIEIIAATHGVDKNFFKYGVYRERFTLRVTPKSGRKPELVAILYSGVPEDVLIADLKSWVQYETLPDGFKSKLVDINVA